MPRHATLADEFGLARVRSQITARSGDASGEVAAEVVEIIVTEAEPFPATSPRARSVGAGGCPLRIQ
eukprot:380989-Alexandrium_andersonii.AAC.1